MNNPNATNVLQYNVCSQCSQYGINSCSLHSPLRFQQPVVIQPGLVAAPWPLEVVNAAVRAYEAMEAYWRDLIERDRPPVILDRSSAQDEGAKGTL